MNLERGFKRVAWVLSSTFGIIVFFIILLSEGLGVPDAVTLLIFIIFWGVGFLFIWFIYWALRWIILGFREDSNRPKDITPKVS